MPKILESRRFTAHVTGYFGTSVVTPRLAGITDSTELVRFNTGLWHGKAAIDFSGTLNSDSLVQGTCAEKTLVVPGAVIEDVIAPAWPRWNPGYSE